MTTRLQLIAFPVVSLGDHQPTYDRRGRRIGSTVETLPGRYVAVCGGCRQPTTARGTRELAEHALHFHSRTCRPTPPPHVVA